MTHEAKIIANYAKKVLPLATARLGDEYYYQSLPLCVIDAVYSIGVRYEGVKKVVNRYGERYGLIILRESKGNVPSEKQQESISAFCAKVTKIGSHSMADGVFKNCQRTSTRSGILKAEAVNRFAAVLNKHGVDYLQDIRKILCNIDFERDIRNIPGQGSGISLKYFLMLAGSDNLIKPDRWISTFIRSVLGRELSFSDTQKLLFEAAIYLKITPRLFDHEIWKYQRSTKSLPPP